MDTGRYINNGRGAFELVQCDGRGGLIVLQLYLVDRTGWGGG